MHHAGSCEITLRRRLYRNEARPLTERDFGDARAVGVLPLPVFKRHADGLVEQLVDIAQCSSVVPLDRKTLELRAELGEEEVGPFFNPPRQPILGEDEQAHELDDGIVVVDGGAGVLNGPCLDARVLTHA